MTTELSEWIPQEILQWYTWMQRYVMEKLQSKWAWLDQILDDIIQIRDTAERPTPTWDMVEDPVARLAANKLLLELMWVYKSKWGINMNFNISDLLYAPRQTPVQPTAEVIQGWS